MPIRSYLGSQWNVSKCFITIYCTGEAYFLKFPHLLTILFNRLVWEQLKQKHSKLKQNFKITLRISNLIMWKLSPPLTWIYQPSLQKTSFILWAYKRQSSSIDSPTITWKITTIRQTFVLFHLKGNTQLHIRKNLVSVYQHFIYPFLSDSC